MLTEVEPGTKLGRFTVIAHAPTRRHEGGSRRYVIVRCACGNERETQLGGLLYRVRRGGSPSCGCAPKRYRGRTPVDLTGQRFGRLVAVERESTSISERGRFPGCGVPRPRHWLCACDCGNVKRAIAADLLAGKQKSCGCLKDDNTSARGRAKTPDITGRRFGRLVVEGGLDYATAGASWLCACDCGRRIRLPAIQLTANKQRSCGCIKGPPDAWVYFVQVSEDGPIKIGFTSRMTTLQISSPFDLVLRGRTRGGAALERKLHARFASARMRGEWFHPTPELVQLIADFCD